MEANWWEQVKKSAADGQRDMYNVYVPACRIYRLVIYGHLIKQNNIFPV